MHQTPIVDSIASSNGSIGAGAAGHLDLAIREIMGGQGAVRSGKYLRLITGEQHPFGNMAILSDASCLETTEEAVAALLDLKDPTMVLYTTGVSDLVAQRLLNQGFNQSSMPAMAVD